ncbi:MAG TPA: hypothetical protein VM511_09725 [Luteolibacter sp.]|nr:hypothetical protein [Luteolibacter sp.]
MKPRLLLHCLAGVAILATRASAVTLLSDNFSDGDHTNQNLPTSGAWYAAHAGSTTLSTNGTQQNLLSDSPAASNSQVWTTFANTTIAQGETLTASFNFDVSGGANGGVSDGAFRIGLFNVTTPVTANINGGIANANWNGATGYSAFVDVSPSLNTVATSTLRQRTGASDTLWAAAATTGLTTNVSGDETVYTGLTNNVATDPLRFLATLSLTRTGADSLNVLLTISGGGITNTHTLSATDGSGIASTFNTFSVFSGTSSAQDIAIDNVVITVVPEPSVLFTAALAPILLGFRRRR